ncbi:MAG: large conductance mechanosensitive channel protein MscL [Clostridia bacterium]|nr:large conductance mechanosensitive channel protein MscL [Clostridia bacterium]
MKKFFKEFKEFALKGNAMDLAVGVIIGAAFKAIVDSFVGDIISPLIGLIFKCDFKDLSVNIAGIDLAYGNFITAVINFIIMAFVIFCIIKAINKASTLVKKDEEKEEEKTEKTCPYCCSTIPIKATKCPACTSDLK